MRLAIPIESGLYPVQDGLVGDGVGSNVKAAGECTAEVVENGAAMVKKMRAGMVREPDLGAGVGEEAIERGEGAGGW